jgi:hypothetical protein
VGLTGKPFTVKHKDRVTEMTRAFLDYMKSLRLQAPEAINPVPVQNNNLGTEPNPEPEPDAEPDRESSWDIKLTDQATLFFQILSWKKSHLKPSARD